MADNRNFHAVVRGSTSEVPTAATNIPINNNPLSATLTFNKGATPFYDYPSFDDQNTNKSQIQGGLGQQLYNNWGFNFSRSSNSHLNSSSNIIHPFTVNIGQLKNQILPRELIQSQLLIRPQLLDSRVSRSSFSSPPFHSMTIRSQRRSIQQMKLVREMTQKELTSDSWAWRKYGQKLIKGSPNPRNYYRCSTSKGCCVKKQVEKSFSDPDIYVVSYFGEHTHPSPTHQNSLAGTSDSSRTILKPVSGDIFEAPPSSVVVHDDHPLIEEGGSSTTPHEKTQTQTLEISNDNNDKEMEDVENYDDILIPNNSVMSQDILKGFEELKRFSDYL